MGSGWLQLTQNWPSFIAVCIQFNWLLLEGCWCACGLRIAETAVGYIDSTKFGFVSVGGSKTWSGDVYKYLVPCHVIRCRCDMGKKQVILVTCSTLAYKLLELLGFSARVAAKHNLWSSGIAMATGESQSQRWSCGTLQDGVQHMDLSLEEQKLLRDIQATLTVSDWVCTKYQSTWGYWMVQIVCFNNPFSEQALDDEIALAEGPTDSSGSQDAWNWVCLMHIYMCI